MTLTPAQPTRRAVVRGAAWSVPVVAVSAAAPAFAASCTPKAHLYTLNWGSTTYSHPNNTPNQGVATIPSSNGGPTIFAVFSAAFFGPNASGDGNMSSGEARNLSVPTATPGSDSTRDPAITNLGALGGVGGNEKGIRLQQTNSSGSLTGNRQEVTVTFRTGSALGPLVNVQGLTFSIVDIDAITTSAYSDRVVVSPEVSVSQQVRDNNITGLGTTESPWRNTQSNTNFPENQAGARVRVNYPSTTATAFSSFKLTYWTATGSGQYHRIFLSDMAFNVPAC